MKQTEFQAKTVLGACLSQAINWYFGPLSWAAWGISVAGGQIAVHGLDALVNRCTQSAIQNRQVRAVPAQQQQGNHRPQSNFDPNFDPLLEEALRQSQVEFQAAQQQDKENKENLQDALNASKNHPEFSVYQCSMGSLSGDESLVSEAFKVNVGGRDYHLFTLLFSLLSQSQLVDPFSHAPIPQTEITAIAERLGLDSGSFQNIWYLSQGNLGPTHPVPETESNLRRVCRYHLLKDLLSSEGQWQKQDRQKQLRLLNLELTWRQNIDQKNPLV